MFTLVTYHRTILSPKKGVPPLAAARTQRWALRLSAYTYEIEFRPTRAHGNADGLSRLPLGSRQQPATGCIFTLGQVQALPVTAERLEITTCQDPLYGCFIDCTARTNDIARVTHARGNSSHSNVSTSGLGTCLPS